LIVHVTGRSPLTSARTSPRLAGTMRLVTVTPTRRFLRITVDESLSPKRRAAVLAHELWHALEVAREPHVVDRHSFEALYQHIGHRSFGMSSWYDTGGGGRRRQGIRGDPAATHEPLKRRDRSRHPNPPLPRKIYERATTRARGGWMVKICCGAIIAVLVTTGIGWARTLMALMVHDEQGHMASLTISDVPVERRSM